jgi:hypothetical protein
VSDSTKIKGIFAVQLLTGLAELATGLDTVLATVSCKHKKINLVSFCQALR